MTKRYPGGYITKTPPTVSTTSAPGIWTMEQQAAYQKAGTWPFGGPFTYIEDVFSTYLYTGNGSTQTITNGIDLTTYGGLTWLKQRNDSVGHRLYDTVRGATKLLESNGAAAQSTSSTGLTAFTSSGFSLGNDPDSNTNNGTYASWTFRKQPKFFDVVTYTGDGAATRTISHNLGSTPGFVIIKNMDQSGNWMCWHNSFAATDYIALNTTGAKNYAGTYTDIYKGVSSTTVTIGSNAVVNNSGYNYVMYVFAHNAGGFGTSNSDNVISCGSFTGNTTVNLGYEPQWVLLKNTALSENWVMFDNMRGLPADFTQVAARRLYPNLSNAESSSDYLGINATGFTGNLGAQTYIYIAIRRGPMKAPTSGTSVFSPVARTGTGASAAVTTPGFPPDMLLQARRGAPDWPTSDRLRGVGQNLGTCYTSAETTPSPAYVESYDMTGATLGSSNAVNGSGLTYIEYFFRRAPSFFDEVCYTGNGVNGQSFTHNLGAVPELMIVKNRSSSYNWVVYNSTDGYTYSLYLNTTGAKTTGNQAWYAAPTSTAFSVTDYVAVNSSGSTYVAYLFASCPGVSKVGSYTGTGALQNINCGFSGGARFVMIKRTDSTSDWFVWDTARGMVAGTDPSLSLNTTAAEVNANSAYTNTGGFQLLASPAADVNTNGGSYIYLAIA